MRKGEIVILDSSDLLPGRDSSRPVSNLLDFRLGLMESFEKASLVVFCKDGKTASLILKDRYDIFVNLNEKVEI